MYIPTKPNNCLPSLTFTNIGLNTKLYTQLYITKHKLYIKAIPYGPYDIFHI